jgi:hypothetical protein
MARCAVIGALATYPAVVTARLAVAHGDAAMVAIKLLREVHGIDLAAAKGVFDSVR